MPEVLRTPSVPTSPLSRHRHGRTTRASSQQNARANSGSEERATASSSKPSSSKATILRTPPITEPAPPRPWRARGAGRPRSQPEHPATRHRVGPAGREVVESASGEGDDVAWMTESSRRARARPGSRQPRRGVAEVVVFSGTAQHRGSPTGCRGHAQSSLKSGNSRSASSGPAGE